MKESESVSCSVTSDALQPWDWSPPGSPVHGIFQARTLEWLSIPFSRGSSQPRDWTRVSWTQILYPVSHQQSPIKPKPGTKSWCSFSHNIIKGWEWPWLLCYPKGSPSRTFVSMLKSLDSAAGGVFFTKRSRFLPGHTIMVSLNWKLRLPPGNGYQRTNR